MRLEARHKLLANAAIIIDSANDIASAVEAQRDQLSAVVQIAQDQRMQSDATHNLRELLQSTLIQLDEAYAETARFAASVELDPEGLRSAEERLSALYDLARKHRVNRFTAAVAKRFEGRLSLLREGQIISTLEEALDDTTTAWRSRLALSTKRQAAGKQASRHGDSGSACEGKCVLEISLSSFKNTPDPRGARMSSS